MFRRKRICHLTQAVTCSKWNACLRQQSPCYAFDYLLDTADPARVPRPARLTPLLRGHLQIRSPDALKALAVPTLFITGEEDVVFPPLLAAPLAALMPNARVEQVAAAGHSAYFERADVFNRLVEEFFAGVG
jgi:pimeloyl-ACP methyl ester carboxylesterase